MAIMFKYFGILFFSLVFGTTVVYANGTISTISWTKLIISLSGGLMLFLYGMEMMSDGMKKTAGDKMRMILASLTRNRVIALFCGAFVTMVIQSSSATTVMLVSFVQAGLMTFTQSLGVILGADIGTTITAQMIAFKLTDYALLMVTIGFLIRMFGKNQNIKNIGEAILGFGILFFGMKIMSDAMKPLRTHAEFISMLRGLENPILGVLLAAAFTALIQSSSAFTGIIIVLAQQNLITLEAGIPMVLGANIGTCVTAGLATIGTSREAKRVALAHVTFKIVGVLLFIFWIPTFAEIIRSLAVRFDSGTARQIANAHTIFNVGLGLTFLPFTSIFGRFILKILPEKEEDTALIPTTWHLDDAILSTPAMALDLARTEVARMVKLTRRMLRAVIIPFFTNKPQEDEYFPPLSLLDGIRMREEKIDYLEERISQYLTKISQQGPNSDQVKEIFTMMSIVSDIENIGDLISRNLLPLILKKRALDKNFSEDAQGELMIYHQKACKQLALLEETLAERNWNLAKHMMQKEKKYLDLEQQYKAKHLHRLFAENADTIETHEIHMELMDYMKQIIVFSGNIANTFNNLSKVDSK
jgi:phosphate:Na+ symporter